MSDLSKFCCLNSSCKDHGKRGGKNLRWGAWSGKKKKIRMVLCKTCRRSFSERKGTPLFQSHLAEDKAMAVLHHLADGCGVRQTGRLTGISKDTASRYSKKVGPHAAALHDELVAFSPEDEGGSARRTLGFRRQERGPLRTRGNREGG